MSPRQKKALTDTTHRFYQLLHHVGWSLTALEEPTFLPGFSQQVKVQVAPTPDGKTLTFLFCGDILPSLEQAFKGFEDLTLFHRSLQLALEKEGIAKRNVVLIDQQLGVQVVDFEQEDVLLDARGEEELTERILPLLSLNNLARGSLSNFPRKTPRQRARELHHWTAVWSARIGAAARTSRTQATNFFQWLFLSRLAEQLGIGPDKKLRFCEYGDHGRSHQPVRFLEASFRPLRESWNLLQGSELSTQKEIAAAAHGTGQLADCLQSFALLSRGKFASDIFAEAFADEELRIIGWRHSLIEKELVPEADPMRWMQEAMIVDLDTVGFTGMIRSYNRITDDLRRLAREQAVSRERGERPGLQMDVFGTEPPQIDEEDAPRITLQTGLEVFTSRRDRAEIAKFVLLAHTAEWYAHLRRHDPIFSVPKVHSQEPLKPRPATVQQPGQSDPSLN